MRYMHNNNALAVLGANVIDYDKLKKVHELAARHAKKHPGYAYVVCDFSCEENDWVSFSVSAGDIDRDFNNLDEAIQFLREGLND